MSEPIALASVTAYIVLDNEDGTRTAINTETWPFTDDPDSHADAVLRELALKSNGVDLAWRLTGGDDHDDGLTSYQYVAEVPDMDSLRACVEYGGDADDPTQGATPNMGILTGPGEYGYIPAGVTYGLNGMDYNMGGVTRIAGADMALFPITEDAARYLGVIE